MLSNWLDSKPGWYHHNSNHQEVYSFILFSILCYLTPSTLTTAPAGSLSHPIHTTAGAPVAGRKKDTLFPSLPLKGTKVIASQAGGPQPTSLEFGTSCRESVVQAAHPTLVSCHSLPLPSCLIGVWVFLEAASIPRFIVICMHSLWMYTSLRVLS